MNFLIAHGKKLLIGLISVFVVIIAIVIVAEVRQTNKEQGLVLLESLIDENENSDLSDQEFEAYNADIANASKDAYLVQRTLFLQARRHWEQQEYQKAGDAYAMLAQNYRTSHLGQISYFNAAIAYEQSGDTQRAITLLEESLLDSEDTPNPLVPRILLNLGRLYEQNSDLETAKVYYNTILNEHSGNQLVNIANSRLITIDR